MDKGYLKVILGSMFSGKTTELIKEYHRHDASGFKCCFINHSFDEQRFGGGKNTKAHNKLTVKTDYSVKKLIDIWLSKQGDKQDSINKAKQGLCYDVYFINEGQFFEDLYNGVNMLVNEHKKKVYVCGLDGDFERKKFGSLLDIIPLCDDVIKLKGLCSGCKYNDGIFTFRLTNEQQQTVIGSENYRSLCRHCYNITNKMMK